MSLSINRNRIVGVHLAPKEGSDHAAFKTALETFRLLIDSKNEVPVPPKSYIMYTTPEKLHYCTTSIAGIRKVSAAQKLHSVIVDEAHAFVSGARDFRPAMKCVRFMRDNGIISANVPIGALTATADQCAIQDMKSVLGLRVDATDMVNANDGDLVNGIAISTRNNMS